MLKGKSKSTLYLGSEVPGPGKYSPNLRPIEHKISQKYLQMLRDPHSITFGGRIESVTPNRDIPGPGQYDVKGTLNELGTSVKIGHSARNDSLERFITSSPGPAAYLQRKEFSRNYAPKYTYWLLKITLWVKIRKRNEGKNVDPN